MEPTRYWLLYSGVLLIFLSSRIGHRICMFLFNILRSAFYLTIALFAACGYLIFSGLAIVISWLEKLRKSRSGNSDIGSPVRAKI